jgi:hypothetical protein
LAVVNLKFEKLKSKKKMKNLLTLIIVAACAIFIQAQDSTLAEIENRIYYCDSMATVTINKILQIPDEKEIKRLAIQARDWTIRREVFEEAKRVYLKGKK